MKCIEEDTISGCMIYLSKKNKHLLCIMYTGRTLTLKFEHNTDSKNFMILQHFIRAA